MTGCRAAVPDATAALIVTGAIFGWLFVRVRTGVSRTLDVMPFLADANAFLLYWWCLPCGWSAGAWSSPGWPGALLCCWWR